MSHVVCIQGRKAIAIRAQRNRSRCCSTSLPIARKLPLSFSRCPGSVLHGRKFVAAAAADDDVNGVDPVILAPITTSEQLEQETQWLASKIQQWLDEEWITQDVHRDLGQAAATAYSKIRSSGEDEAGSVLLALGSELLVFEFRDTFTNAFEVANKVVEMVMMREGCDVCCTSEDDKLRVQS